MNRSKIYVFLVLIIGAFGLQSCQQAGVNNPGSEYMPDMGHSVAYEANYYNYYYYNTWGSEDEYYKFAQPGLPVNGTVPRRSNAGGFNIPTQGSVPYYYADTEEEGNGYLVRDDGGVYPVQPANFLLEEHVNASNGRYYHSIMWGKNLMGSYKDKISYEERWNVIHYIRSLQAKELKKEYNQEVNTLNDVDQPAGKDYMAANMVEQAEGHDVDLEHSDNHHHVEGDGHDHGENHDH